MKKKKFEGRKPMNERKREKGFMKEKKIKNVLNESCLQINKKEKVKNRNQKVLSG